MEAEEVLFLFSSILFFFSLFFIFLVFMETRKNKKRIKELEEREKEYETKRKILSRISHELRTPVIGISGMIKIAQQNIDDKEKVEECLTKINRSAKYLFDLLDDVLDIVKLKSGMFNVKNKKINLGEIMNNCVSITSERFYDRKIEYVKVAEDVEKYKLKGDELHLTQIFVNILCNAVKYTKDGGFVIFKAKEFKNNQNNDKGKVYYQFKISDTGAGMHQSFLNKIWTEFAQDDNKVVMEKYKGTGLGLSIVKRYIDLVGGTISVESELGKGTTFTIVLPFELENEEIENVVTESEENEEVEHVDLSGVSVVIVDDDELNLEIGRYMLEREKIKVYTANGGEELLKMLEESKGVHYDVILMDINMPGMNGFETAKKIREMDEEELKDIPIVALTAQMHGEEIERVKDSGMNTYLIKPIDEKKIVNLIKSIRKEECIK